MKNKEMKAILRPKRQVTLPREICERMGIQTGDVLELTVENSKLVAKPRKTRSLEALKEIQRIFEKSGITEDELQEAGKRARREIVRERYGKKA
jgi:bifunctional DNA-binding transcriptional regulator/antitoxin component of YhaV-PrlF toxin-antitoxin module